MAVNQAEREDVNYSANTDNDVAAVKKVNKSKSKNKGKHKSRTKTGWIIALVVVLVVVAGFGIAVGLNLFKVRDNFIYPVLRNIPIINNVIPSAAEPEEDEFAGITKEQMALEIENLKLEAEKKDQELNDLKDKSNLYVQEITRLTDIETQQIQFKEDKAAFDEMIAKNDPEAYAKFYENIDPTHAEELYKEAVAANAATSEVKKFIATFTSMDSGDAAAILEEMVRSDLSIVVGILNNMDADSRGAIMAELTPVSAALVTKRLSPTLD